MSTILKNFKKYIIPHKLFFILTPLFMLTEVVGEIMLPKLVSFIINEGIASGDKAYIIAAGLKMVLIAIVMMCGGVLGGYCATRASVSFASDLRLDVFSRLQMFSFKNIDNFSTGSLVTRLTNDITQVQNVIRMGLIMTVRSPGMLIGALFMASTINYRLALVIAIVIPFLVLSVFLILRTAFPRFDQMQKKLDRVNTTIQENITNMRVIKSFLRRDFEIKRFYKSNHELMEATLNAMKVVIMVMPVATVAMNVTTIAVVWVGGNFVMNGHMEIGDLTAFTTYIVQILMSLMMLSMIFLQCSRAAASLRRINELLCEKVDLNDDTAAHKELRVASGAVEFKNVSFKYSESDSENILSDLSFTVNPGEIVGIIGMTGCGKTSLVQLIPRLYDVTEGQVLVDGVDVRDYDIKNLRDGVAMVLQNNVLFSGTLKENLKWGNDNATDEEIQMAAETAQVSSFVDSLAEGYDTHLEQGGMNLSGGQKQRVCIARALLKNPKILILDDSTSAVDSATEAKIRQSFREELRDTTKIIIAQRIQSVIDADKILVIDDGRIVGEGTHSQLMESSEEYRDIYYSQMDKEVSA